MVLDISIIAACLLLILASCAIFVNAIEIFGKLFNLHQGIIGSVLAAVGTALPETIIPVIAIIFTKGENANAIGIGAIAGAPFMLGTLGFFITGVAVIVNTVLGRRSIVMNADVAVIARDLTFFLIFYGIAVGASLLTNIPFAKAIIALVLLLSYGLYLKWTFGGKGEAVENVDVLYLSRFFKAPQTFFWVMTQLLFSLALLVAGAHFFIIYIQEISFTLGISPLILSLLITPIATELPEKLNSIIWIGKKKDTLALGNITGAMVFQSCFPVVFGMLFTPWNLKGQTMLSAVLALLSGLTVLLWIRLRKACNPFLLLAGGLFYGIFIAHLIFVKKW
ncbi:MAG: hypothetical protein PHC61_17045 [Chitinivibrionales bacterium]|nr:hypothetical protein [Chitinivibrionales bacterium]